MPQTPLKIVNTKHSGQQSLSIRSDGKIFATAGWDAKVRVYSTKGGMKELAVLKWHKEGLYAMGFGEVLEGTVEGKEDRESINPPESSGGEVVRMGKEGGVLPKVKTVEQMREERERRRHWLAAGSKDGKVSLWEVY